MSQRLTRYLSRPDSTHPEWAEASETMLADRQEWCPAAAWFSANWIADAGCLALSFYVLHAGPPWLGLPLAYLAGQLAALLPFTPGGIGVVEGGLAVALTAFGTPAVTSLAVVLVYRLISFWALLPAGAVAYLAIRHHRRPLDGTPPSRNLRIGQVDGC